MIFSILCTNKEKFEGYKSLMKYTEQIIPTLNKIKQDQIIPTLNKIQEEQLKFLIEKNQITQEILKYEQDLSIAPLNQFKDQNSYVLFRGILKTAIKNHYNFILPKYNHYIHFCKNIIYIPHHISEIYMFEKTKQIILKISPFYASEEMYMAVQFNENWKFLFYIHNVEQIKSFHKLPNKEKIKSSFKNNYEFFIKNTIGSDYIALLIDNLEYKIESESQETSLESKTGSEFHKTSLELIQEKNEKGESLIYLLIKDQNESTISQITKNDINLIKNNNDAILNKSKSYKGYIIGFCLMITVVLSGYMYYYKNKERNHEELNFDN